MIVGGAFGAIVQPWVFVSRSETDKQKEELSKKVPFLGLGVGYGAAKVGGLAPMQSLGIGLVVAYLAYEYKRRCATKMRDKDENTSTNAFAGSAAPHFAAWNPSPLSAPVARGLIVPPF